MNTIHIGLIGYGTVGQGVAKILHRCAPLYKKQYNADFSLRKVFDRSLAKKDTRYVPAPALAKSIDEVVKDPAVDVVIELIGGTGPAKKLIVEALKGGKHVITANKELIANCGAELFALARKNGRCLYYESAVMAGIPVIKTISEGLAGNRFDSLYGIINGTCNFILTEMFEKHLSFGEALKLAQQNGYAESNPTLDINGMDTAHKLAILIFLAMGKYVPVKDIYTEGITQIDRADIEHAESLGLRIKLLAIAKREEEEIEARVHPTLISGSHPLASINGVLNAAYMEGSHVGKILLSGKGAGQMTAASGVISDLISLAARGADGHLPSNNIISTGKLKLCKIDDIETKFYLRFTAPDKPGTLSKITGVLGKHGIGINSVTQKPHIKKATVPVIMLTDFTTERALRKALNEIHTRKMVSARPVAIRMEKL